MRPAPSDRLALTSRRWKRTRLAVARLIMASGALHVWDRVANRSTPRILYYHNVHGPDDDVSWCREPSLTLPVALFQEHIESLTRRYTVVTLDEITATPSPDQVALTFDDGYRGVYQHAFPLLRQWGIPATVFLVSSRVGSAEVLWWDRLLSGVERLRHTPEGGTDGEAPVSPQWRQLLRNAPLELLLDAYKSASPADRDQVDRHLAALSPACGRAGERIFLSPEEVREMRLAGWAFGAHTVDHPLLPWLTDQELRDQLVGSRDVVLTLTGQQACWFSYPDGTFGPREEAAVRRAGFIGAVQTGRRPERSGRFALPRIGISPWVIAASDGSYSHWREHWAIGRLTRARLFGLLRGGDRWAGA